MAPLCFLRPKTCLLKENLEGVHGEEYILGDVVLKDLRPAPSPGLAGNAGSSCNFPSSPCRHAGFIFNCIPMCPVLLDMTLATDFRNSKA